MKKLMIAAAIVCAAAVSQAAMVNWTSSAINCVDLEGLTGNGSYSAGGGAAKGNGSISWSVQFFAEGTSTTGGDVLGEFTGTTLITGSKISKTGNLSGLAASTTYDYIVSITVQPSDLRALTDKDGWDYSNAELTYTSTGTWKTNPSGASPFTETPTTWKLTGAVEVVPEPTTGLLMLIGMAGLALRRRRA